MRQKIKQNYRVRLILDNLPVTTYDLEEHPDSVRPGFMVGVVLPDGRVTVNNHLMFKVLVHKTNGEYTRTAEELAEVEAAAAVEVSRGGSPPLASLSACCCVGSLSFAACRAV